MNTFKIKYINENSLENGNIYVVREIKYEIYHYFISDGKSCVGGGRLLKKYCVIINDSNMKKEYNTIEEIQKRLKHLKKAKSKIQDEQSLLLDKRNELCKCEEKESKSYYNSGSYLETGYYETWDECKICHKKYNIIRKSTGSYN